MAASKANSTRQTKKDPQAYRTISEVAEELNLAPHVLRFWETKFAQLHPLKLAGGRRHYRPSDIELLYQIRELVHGQGYTLRGARQKLQGLPGGQKSSRTARTSHGTAAPQLTIDSGLHDDFGREGASPEIVMPTEGTPTGGASPMLPGEAGMVDGGALRDAIAELEAVRDALREAVSRFT